MATPTDQTDDDRERIEVLVRAPSGASHRFPVAPDELTVQVIASAIEHFVEHNQLAQGDYALAVVRDGQAVPVPVADTSRVAELHITKDDVFVLVPEAPQVDG